jgi:hypothetical protein
VSNNYLRKEDNDKLIKKRKDEDNVITNEKKQNKIINKKAKVTTPTPMKKSSLLNGSGDGACPTPPTNKPRADDSSAKTNIFRVYSQNVHGLRDETKLEHIPRIMKENNLDAYLVQETHLAGDFEKTLISDYYLIHHGPETQPSNGAKGGVAIILSPDLTTTWKASGKAKKCLKSGPSVGNTTRFLSVNLRLGPTKDHSQKYHNLCLTSIYFL